MKYLVILLLLCSCVSKRQDEINRYKKLIEETTLVKVKIVLLEVDPKFNTKQLDSLYNAKFK